MVQTRPFTHVVRSWKNGDHDVKVANHWVHTTKKGIYFQSYLSTILFIPKDKRRKIVFGRDWNYSNTTRKHLYQFLRDKGIMVHSAKDVENLNAKFVNHNIIIDY